MRRISSAVAMLAVLAALTAAGLARGAPTTAQAARLNALGDQAEAAQSAENWRQVERIAREALALSEQAYGPNHPTTAIMLSLLAYSFEKRGRLTEAEPLHRRELAINRGALGERAPDTIETTRNLAANLDLQGRRADAEPFHRAALEARRASLGEADRRVAVSAYDLAANLDEQGRFGEAEPAYRLALKVALAASGERHVDAIQSYANLASNLGHQGRVAEGEPLLRRALESAIALKGEKDALTAQMLAGLGVNLHDQGRYAQAEPLLRRALDIRIATLGERHPSTASSYHNLATDIEDQGRYAEAEPLMRKALEIRRAVLGPRDPELATTINNLATLTIYQDHYADAEPLLRESMAILEATYGERHPRTAAAYVNLAADLEELKRRPEAEALYRKALVVEEATLGERHPDPMNTNNNLALLLNRDGKGAEAERLQAKAVAVARFIRRRERERAGADAGDGITTEFVFANYMDIAFDAASAAPVDLPRMRAEAFTAAQDFGSSNTGKAMARAAARVAAGQAGLADTVRRQQDLAAQAETLDAQLLAALSSGDAAAAGALRMALERDRAELDRLDQEIRAKFPPYAELIAPEAASVAEVQRRLKPDEAVLFLRPIGPDMHVFAVSKTAVAWRRTPELAQTAAGAVRTLRCQVDPATCPVGTPPIQGLPPFDRGLAWSLYRDLVAPVEGALAGVKTLYVTAQGPLSALPFGLLLTAPPHGAETAEALASAQWLADRYALVTLPSVSSLRVLGVAQAQGSRAFAGFGDPVLGRPPAAGEAPRGLAKRGTLAVFRGAGVDGVALADPEALRVGLERLPGAAAELDAMARTLHAPASALHVGAAATETAVKGSADLRQARVVVFATHGLLPRELKGVDEPGLVFTPPKTATAQDDGMLTASEAARLSLTADWVILSACNTASADGGPGGETLSGLAKAFLYAGAHAMLVSHWRVIDEVTSVLTVQTLAIQAANPALSKAQALQAAMRAVRTGKLPGGAAVPGWYPEWAHPAAWAPFILVTAGE